MYPFGSIVLARFPFTDLSGSKLRPALVVSRQAAVEDVIVCFITSKPRSGPSIAQLPPEPWTGLKQASAVRLDKIATLHSGVIAGSIGTASAEWLLANAERFFGVFGFVSVDNHGPLSNAG